MKRLVLAVALAISTPAFAQTPELPSPALGAITLQTPLAVSSGGLGNSTGDASALTALIGGVATPLSKVPASAIPAVSNFDPLNLPYARAAMARVRAKTGRMKIAALGDSLTAGQGSGSGTYQTINEKATSYPTALVNLLNGYGIPASLDSQWSDSNVSAASGGATVTPWANFAVGAGWVISSSNVSIGGGLWNNTSTTGTALALTTSAAVDTCDVYYLNYGGGQFSVDIDGGGTIYPTLTGPTTLAKATLTASLATHTVNVKRTSSTGQVFIAGADCYAAANHQVSVWNWGSSGSQAGVWWSYAANPFSPLNAIGFYAPDLTIINLGTNDENAGVTYATFTANMQAIITAAKASGDVILVFHSDNANSGAMQGVTLAALQALAASNNLPLINMTSRLGPWATIVSVGEAFYAPHLLAPGYADQASLIADLLRRL